MKSAVVVFPGSNCDRDMAVAIERVLGRAPAFVWWREASLPADVDLVALPGGFAHGDYLRPGAIAARSASMRAVAAHAARGGFVLGVCNGFQVLLEAGLLPGALMRNANRLFACREVALRVESRRSPFLADAPDRLRLPVAHHDGAYAADPDTLSALSDADRIALRYDGDNPNGSVSDIAGVTSENGRVLGMMPHPERAVDPVLGRADGVALFSGLSAFA